MHNFTLVNLNGSYMFQPQISHHQTVYVRDIKGNDTSLPVVYI